MAASFLVEITISSSSGSAAAPGSSPCLGRGGGMVFGINYAIITVLLSVLPCSSAVGAHSGISSETEHQRMHLMAKLHMKHILRRISKEVQVVLA